MLLFKDRILNIALLISASWHAVFMFTVAPVLISGDIKKNATVIASLGAILEKVAVIQEKALDLDQTSFVRKLRQSDAIESVPARNALAQPEILDKAVDVSIEKETFVFFEEKGNVITLYSKKKDRRLLDFKNSMLRGEARNRMVLYRPRLPRPLVLPADFNSDYSAAIKFRISKEGFVERPECVLSSGSFTIDQTAIRYIRQWQFYPYHDETGAGQEASIRLNFNPL